MTEAPSKKRVLFLILRWTGVAVLMGLVVRALIVNFPDLEQRPLSLDPWWLLLSIALLGLHYLILALCWHGVTLANQVALPVVDAVLVWNYSMLGKYLPGKVAMFLGRAYFYKRRGHSLGGVSLALWIDLALQTLSGLLVVALWLAFTPDGPMLPYRPVVWLVAAGLVVACYPRAIQLAINLILRLLGRPRIEVSMRTWHSGGLLLLYLANSFLLGLAFFAFVRGFYPVLQSQFVALTGSFLLAGLSGMLSLFAPGGLGVREAVLLLTLRPFVADGLAGIIVLAARVWTTAVELMWVVCCFGIDRLRRLRHCATRDQRL